METSNNLPKIIKKLYDNNIFVSWNDIRLDLCKKQKDRHNLYGYCWKNINNFNDIKEELDEEGSAFLNLYILSKFKKKKCYTSI